MGNFGASRPVQPRYALELERAELLDAQLQQGLERPAICSTQSFEKSLIRIMPEIILASNYDLGYIP